MAYQIVTMTAQGITDVFPESVEAWAAETGTRITGISANPRTRPELWGHPTISGFIGPCWGGLTEDGEPILRYEDTATYAALSY